jgi:hypothetical protein
VLKKGRQPFERKKGFYFPPKLKNEIFSICGKSAVLLYDPHSAAFHSGGENDTLMEDDICA